MDCFDKVSNPNQCGVQDNGNAKSDQKRKFRIFRQVRENQLRLVRVLRQIVSQKIK